jgi:hypothetical protein
MLQPYKLCFSCSKHSVCAYCNVLVSYLTVYVMRMWYLLLWGPYGLPHGCSKCAFAVFIHVLLNVVICVMARNASVRYVSTSQCPAIYTAFLSSCYDQIYMHKHV